MKKLILGAVAVATVLVGVTAVAQSKVVIKQRPVVITKQGDTYVVPTGTATTTTYYSYTDSGTNYVCTTDEPAGLVGVQSRMISVSVGDSPRSVRCYPESNFTIEAP